MSERFADLPYWPAAMPLKHAALYCGLSPDTFKLRCPVKPIRLGESSRGDRYLRLRLDEWLLSLDTNPPPKPARKSIMEFFADESPIAQMKRESRRSKKDASGGMT